MKPLCGGCRGLGSHARHCPDHPTYTEWRKLADRAEDLGDAIGSNNMAAANACYRASALLMAQHEDELARRSAIEESA